MKFNLLKITLILYFVCSTYTLMHKKEESNTLFDLFGKMRNHSHHKKQATNFRFSQSDKGSEISELQKHRKRQQRVEEEESAVPAKATATAEPAKATGLLLPVNHVVEITDTTVLEDWFTVQSEFFKLNNKFPSVKTNPGTAGVELKDASRVNQRFKLSRTQGGKTNLFFWFKFKKGYFYYFAVKGDLNILDAILIKSIEDNYVPGDGHNKLPTCFDIFDFQSNKFTICADNMDAKLKFLCSIQNYLKTFLDDRCKPDSGAAKIVVKKEYKSLIIIPVASKNCNEKWDYSNKGSDWECTCKEGISQSPIDLPVKSASNPNTLAPMFNYERVDIKPDAGTIDGFVEGAKNINIRYEKNAIRIFHPNMGKTVTVDGAVYVAEEIVFHSPSEHTIDGKQFDLEMQVIHYGRSKGDIANQVVLSILFKNSPGRYNKFLDKIDFFNLPSPKDPAVELQHDFFIPSVFIDSDEDDVIAMEPFSFFTYEGSLSFPPCTERTTYFVTADPVPLSNTVIELFKEALIVPMEAATNEKGELTSIQIDSVNENNRETQPINGRNVYLFDHILNGCINYRPPKRNIKKAGHYEKVLRTADEFIQVSGKAPSGIPGSFVVSENEAFGKKITDYSNVKTK
jgi:carbonic anhydrase